jgi:membrane protease YdiL (CAAX protease family)
MSVPTVPQRAYVEPARERPQTIWTGGKVLVLFLVWLLAAVPPAIVAILVSGDDAEATLSSIPFLFGTLLVQAIATIVAAVLIARAAGGRFGPSIGFRFEISDLVGILLGVALQIGVAIVLAPIALLTDTEDTEQAVGDLIGTGEGATEVTLIVLSVAVLAPLVEEILFRGVLIQWLLSKVNKVWVILFSGVAFGLAHFLPEPSAWLPAIGLVLVGFVLGWMAVRQQRIGMAVTTHAGVNLLAVLLILFGDEVTKYLEDLQDTVESVISLF